MDIMKIMEERHSVRQYADRRIEEEKREILDALCEKINAESGLHAVIFYDEEKGFDSAMAHYGNFTGVKNYIALFGDKGEDEKVGYYGEELVLKAQETGLNTCWVALTFNKKFVVKNAPKGKKLYLVISLGYGKTQGVPHRGKSAKDVTEITDDPPQAFFDGVKGALLAPTAVNQQKFRIIYKDGKTEIVKRGLGFYAEVDLGIVKYHFEKASGIKVFSKI